MWYRLIYSYLDRTKAVSRLFATEYLNNVAIEKPRVIIHDGEPPQKNLSHLWCAKFKKFISFPGKKKITIINQNTL